MTALELVMLSPLIGQTTGRPEVAGGLINGRVAKGHPDLESENIRELPAAKGVLAPCRPAPLVSTGHLLQGYS
jgi:hypothetical protein